MSATDRGVDKGEEPAMGSRIWVMTRRGREKKGEDNRWDGQTKMYFWALLFVESPRALYRSFFDTDIAGDARKSRERQYTSNQARSRILDSIFDNVSIFMGSYHTRRTVQDSILKQHTGRSVSILLFCAVVKGSWNTYPEYQGSISQNRRGGLEFSAENGYNLGSGLVVT